MADYAIIEDSELQAWLKNHADWSLQGGEIVADYKFKNFVMAFGFLAKVAVLAEKHDHHPKIENTYNKVRLSMNTHDAGNKITSRDIKLAEAIESIK